jgi:hypothetical protein
MRLPVLLVALALGAAASLLVACGDRSDLIPSRSASAINRHLDAVDSAVAAGECASASARLDQVRSDLRNLRQDGVSRKLVDNLEQNLSTLSARTSQECGAATTPETTPPETTTTDTETETTDTETETTDTETTDTTTTETTPTDTTPTDTTPTDSTTEPPGTGGFGTGTGTGTGTGGTP